MSEDWKAGDLAVWVAYCGPDPLPAAFRARRVQTGTPPPKRKLVRVIDTVLVGDIKELGLVIAGYPSDHPSKAWHHLMFRKLNDEPDDIALIARIRRCQPAREPSHAS